MVGAEPILVECPLFHREPVHPDIDRVIGDFTSSIMLDVDLTEDMSVADRARALQRSMYEAGRTRPTRIECAARPG